MVLNGLRVLDLTRQLPGPLSTMLMADYGAEVLKVEDIQQGDPTRLVGELIDGTSSFFWLLNRNKKSVSLNLKSAAGKEIFMRLAGHCDVLVEGFRPGVMERLGLGYSEISAVNPGVVYASISGYGQTGPYRVRAGHDINYTAIAGLLDLSATPGSGPVMPAVQIADIGGGSLMALSGIMMALFARAQSGRGSYIDVSMTEGLLPWLSYASQAAASQELPRRGKGHITGAYACYNIYETADQGYMSLGALEPAFWRNFCLAVERPEWIEQQFVLEKQDKLITAVQHLFKRKTRQQWTDFFAGHDACCEPVLELSETTTPYHQSRDFWIEVSRPGGANQRQPGFPMRFDGVSGAVRLPPPHLGEHTFAILKELGYSNAQINSWKDEGVINWT